MKRIILFIINRNNKFQLLFLAILLGTNASFAATKVWDGGGGDTNWTTQNNWSGNTVPLSGDDIVFSGTSTKNCVINTSPPTFNSFSINSGYTGTISFNSQIRKLTISGTFSQSAGTFNHTGDDLSMSTGSFSGGTFNGSSNGKKITVTDLTINGNTFTSTSGTLAILGNFTFSSGSFAHRSGTIILQDNNHTLSGSPTFNNLVIDNATSSPIDFDISSGTPIVAGSLMLSGNDPININTGTIDLTGDLDISGNSSLGANGSGTIQLSNTSSTQTIIGNSVVGAAALPSITIVKGSADLIISGLISFTGLLTYTSGTVDLTGSTIAYVGTTQTVLSPTGGFPNYENLWIGGSGTKTVSGSLTTSSTLTIENSDLDVGNSSNYLDVIDNTSGAVTYTGTGKIIGNLRRSVATGTTYSYPVGSSGNIQRLDINFSNLADHTTVNLSFSTTSPGNSVDAGSENDATFDEMLTNGYWIITGNGADNTTPAYDLSLYPIGFTAGTNVAFTIMKRVGAGNWQLNGTASNPTNATEDGTPADDGVWADLSIRRTGMTGFSNFGIGGSNDPLPVELDYFNACLIEDYVKLDWATLTENKSSHFFIERSPKMDNFKTIGKVASAGTSSERNEYLYNDMSASGQSSDILYYRLKQVDVDGQSKIYPAKAVDIRNIRRESKIKIHPNPAHTDVTVSSFSKEPYNLSIYNQVGEAVYQERVEKETKINVSGFAKGVYIFKCISATGVVNKKVVIE